MLLDPPLNCSTDTYKWGHLAMTYTCIAILVILGDDLSRLDRKAIVEGVASVQRSDGSFSASVEGKISLISNKLSQIYDLCGFSFVGNEFDMRFVYCACCICFMLDEWGTVDKNLMSQYIMNSIVSFFD